MKNYIFLAIISVLFALPKMSDAQCKSFAKEDCKPQLAPFIHDGIYNSTPLTEGETLELYKTFYSDQDYRIVICGEENLPRIEFQVLDSDRNVLFDNRDHDYVNSWDFNLTSSQMLTVSIVVGSEDEMSDEIAQGCVSVLIGFKGEGEEKKE